MTGREQESSVGTERGWSDDAVETATGRGDGVEPEKAGSEDGRRYTQSEMDQAVSRAIHKREEKLEREMSERVSEERRRQEERRLMEQGEYRKLAERREMELEALRAENRARELEAATLSMLGRREMTKLQGLFAHDGGSVEEREAMVDFVDKLIEEEAQRRLEARLQTPAPASGPGRDGSAGGAAGRRSAMSALEKSAFIAERGLEAYKKIPA